MTTKISEKEQAMLAAIELCAGEPLTQLSKMTKYREHTLRYFVQKLQLEGTLQRRAIINFAQLGFTEYSICFSAPSGNRPCSTSTLQHLAHLPRVRSLASLAGDYEYQLICYASNPAELLPFLDAISIVFGDTALQRSVAMRTAEIYYGHKYLTASSKEPKVLKVQKQGRRYQSDHIDRRIINALIRAPFRNICQLARELQMLSTTLQYRLTRLENHNIIAGWIYQVPPQQLGMQPFRVQVSLSAAAREKFAAFCAAHPLVVASATTIGSWDFELLLDAPSNTELLTFRNTLFGNFAASISSVRIFTVLNESSGDGLFYEEYRPEDAAA